MPKTEVAYLGPEGTYSHLVARKYYGSSCTMVPYSTVTDICAFVSKGGSRKGIIPIENSSGGAIYETVDILLSNKPKINIEKELSLDVKLALLGYPGEQIRIVYSHFAPIEHCIAWLRRHLPKAERKITTSTASAAQRAMTERHAASLGSRNLAKIYDLEILHYPVQADIPNITSFLAISGKKTVNRNCSKTMIAARLPNKPGSLFYFLEAFKNENVNLSRLISRPIRGCPREYAFLSDIDGAASSNNVKKALLSAKRLCVYLRVVGSFAIHKRYNS